MELTTQDYLKKALLDTQEKVRDYKKISKLVPDREMKQFFEDAAVEEGLQASKLMEFIASVQ